MKTIAINQYGSADEFTMVDMPTTEPQADEVQVAILVSIPWILLAGWEPYPHPLLTYGPFHWS
ncbi:hypothetical protein [Lactiplantibacillus plantarum]|uniref:hypothetical protein n=1 Tax=Lactiplantibacillus plantarum TaxID=1590 RepID=UPI001EDC6E2E|nr:hypothetical protein [Lactiplantibacillus plantarum]